MDQRGKGAKLETNFFIEGLFRHGHGPSCFIFS